MVRFSEIQRLPDFLQPFSENFRTICPRFENFGNFGWMESAHRHLRFFTRRYPRGRLRHCLRSLMATPKRHVIAFIPLLK